MARAIELYKQKIVTPTAVSVGQDKGGRYFDVLTQEGTKERLRDARVQWRMLRFYKKFTDYKRAGDILKLGSGQISKVLTAAAQESERELVFLYDGDEFINVVSVRHKQIAPTKIHAEVQKAIEEVFGKVPQVHHGDAVWSYRIPVKSEYVAPFLSVDAGSNKGFGHCSIQIFMRLQTIHPLMGKVPCLNWAKIWQPVSDWFGIKINRLEVKIPDGLKEMSAKKIHTLHSDVKAEQFIEPFKEMQHGVQQFKPTIDKAVNSRLKKTEMEAILAAYDSRVDIGDYLQRQILEHVEAESIWGFSNAVSTVRTHGDFRSKAGFDSGQAWKLESIAGEILSLTPMIIELKKQHGDLTTSFLLNPPKKIAAEV